MRVYYLTEYQKGYILSLMRKYKNTFKALAIVALSFLLAFTLYIYGKGKENLGFKLGLDLSGGVQLLYKADVSKLQNTDIQASLSSLKDTIERRVNAFGVAEPIVQIEEGSSLDKDARYRLLVELPGFTDTQKAADSLGKTPVLEFRLQTDKFNDIFPENTENIDDYFGPALITGAHLKRAFMQASSQNGVGISEPQVVLQFNSEGKDLFAKLTQENVGKVFGIFLDGHLISYPVIREPIAQGTAVISGNFSIQEAQELVRNLNFGALPVPIELLSTQSIGASLGHDALVKGVNAAFWGLLLVVIFMIFWYRLPGLVATFALLNYIVVMLFMFKYLPVTLTAAGIAGFILSLGMAVDANVLIFERMKEEIRRGKKVKEAINIGFERAWSSIRDGNLSSLITAAILFWFGTSLLKGFALVFALGVLLSMISAIYISKTFLLALDEILNNEKYKRVLFKSLR